MVIVMIIAVTVMIMIKGSKQRATRETAMSWARKFDSISAGICYL